MLKDVLPVAGSVFKSSQQLYYLGVQSVYVSLERGLFALLLDYLVYLFFGFFIHLFDPARMYSSVGYQLFERASRYLAFYGIEARQNDRLRSIVDYEIDTG